MKFFWPKYPALLKLLYPERITRIDTPGSIYLTFDDGPVPEVTPWVLDKLQEFHAKATFFCIGENVEKHPDIFKRILQEGHAVGNHTHNHLNGWKTSTSDYLENIEIAEKIFSAQLHNNSGVIKEKRKENIERKTTPLFRPPYGKIKNSQARKLSKAGYRIIMWDVISGDYEKEFSPEKCYRNIIENAGDGSTIVLHDSKKAFGNLEVVLPRLLNNYKEKGFEFRSLKDIPSAGQ
ncbi:polysaccharide deacetylase family protein [Gramella jeungdoensis]|uniref:Polysaccharide deacetylase family protein n=1 Tax=Gramella jeungdoensis TaxID=708091 RepID=A0ABT0Z1R6_9FLAO|nr:polysaccharide deacetylase family protein [Gramella jeungdoensis]MCM8568739.1 polysaccharide deacetylase family protein [Gramella jeungdoensis]